jgi:hypothetical protein
MGKKEGFAIKTLENGDWCFGKFKDNEFWEGVIEKNGEILKFK